MYVTHKGITLSGWHIKNMICFPVSSSKQKDARANLATFATQTLPISELTGNNLALSQDFAASVAPVIELFQNVASGQSTLSLQSTASAMKATLDTEQATNVVSSMLEVGEQVVGQFEAFKKMDEVNPIPSKVFFSLMFEFIAVPRILERCSN